MAGAMGSSQRKRKGGRRFLQLYTNVKRSEAYHGLSVYGRAALFEMLERFTGVNNGMIGLGCRELADALNCSRDRAAKALRELDDSGLARPLTAGLWRGKRATEWRLTFFRCNKTGELPVLNWSPQSVWKDAKVRAEGHKEPLSPCGRTQERKNPIKANPLSPSGRTHVDIYQGVTAAGTRKDAAANDTHPDSSGVLNGKAKIFGLSETPEQDPRTAARSRWGIAAERISAEQRERPETARGCMSRETDAAITSEKAVKA